MAGILDSKTRILDFVLTDEGRRQIAKQKLNMSFASFTDGSTFYETDVVSGSSDATVRLYLESLSSIRKDQISVITDDDGRMLPFTGAGDDLFISGGKIFVSGSSIRLEQDEMNDAVSQILESSIDNFKNLRILGTRDDIAEEVGFQISANEITFTVTDRVPFDVKRDVTKLSVEESPGFFQDKRLAHAHTFMYMPPINKDAGEKLGEYPSYGQATYKYQDLLEDLKGRESKVLTFPLNSKESNLFGQIFEVTNGQMTKLDILDFGEINVDDDEHPTKQIFFVGKIVEDVYKVPTYLNIFVLMFD